MWEGLLDEDDEVINPRMWTLLEDALMTELDDNNSAWKGREAELRQKKES